MSQALRIAVVARMREDTALCALLAEHPDDASLPAVFDGTKSQAPPVYDCLTYRMSSAVKDKRFRPALPGLGPSPVEDFYLEAEAWTQSEDSAPVEAIGARLEALFENQAFDVDTAGRVFRSECELSETDHYDNKLKAWFGLFRYRLRFEAGPGNVMLSNITLTASGPVARSRASQVTYYCDTSTGPLILLLFSATGSFGEFAFINVGANPCTVQATSADTLGGAGSIVIAPGDRLVLNDYAPGRFASMSFRNTPVYQGRFPEQALTTTTTLTKPLQNTTYLVDTTAATAPVVIILYASTGDNTKLEFIHTAGVQPVQFALAGTDSTPSTLSNTYLNSIGDVQPWAEIAVNKWAAE